MIQRTHWTPLKLILSYSLIADLKPSISIIKGKSSVTRYVMRAFVTNAHIPTLSCIYAHENTIKQANYLSLKWGDRFLIAALLLLWLENVYAFEMLTTRTLRKNGSIKLLNIVVARRKYFVLICWWTFKNKLPQHQAATMWNYQPFSLHIYWWGKLNVGLPPLWFKCYSCSLLTFPGPLIISFRMKHNFAGIPLVDV